MTAVMEPSTIPHTFLPNNDFSLRCRQFRSSAFLPPDRDSPTTSSSGSRKPQSIHQLSHSASPHPADNHHTSRKRPRLERRTPRQDTYPISTSSGREALSPSPFVNTNYRIAGGLETPGIRAAQLEEDVGNFDFEIDCRPNRYKSQPSSHTSDSYFPQTPALDSNERTKRGLIPPSSPMKGWGKTVWALTGGIAGKVFNFCWSNSFNGFHAGGGGSYEIDTGTPGVVGSAWTEVDSKDDVFHNDYGRHMRRADRDSTPVPGGFPEEGPEFIEDYMSKLTVDPAEARTTPTKKSRPQAPVVSRYNSWVVVDGTTSTSRTRESSPVRKKSRASTASLYATQSSSVPRHSNQTQSRPRLTPRSSTGRSSASYASPRDSLGANLASQPHVRHSTASTPTAQSYCDQENPEPPSRHTTPISGHKSRPSLATHRRDSSLTSSKPQSPEVRKFEQKLRKKAAKQDQTINLFNDKLQAMIQEGQAALGSRIEVEMSDDDGDGSVTDEGYFEEDRKSGSRHWSRS